MRSSWTVSDKSTTIGALEDWIVSRPTWLYCAIIGSICGLAGLVILCGAYVCLSLFGVF